MSVIYIRSEIAPPPPVKPESVYQWAHPYESAVTHLIYDETKQRFVRLWKENGTTLCIYGETIESTWSTGMQNVHQVPVHLLFDILEQLSAAKS